MKRYYKDFYGCTASIAVSKDGSAKLTIRTDTGKIITRKTYSTERGARIALGHSSDCWHPV